MKQVLPRLVFWTMATGWVFGCANAPLAGTKESLATPATGQPGEAHRLDSDQVVLGRFLFCDRRLSRNREVACSSCHTLTKFGVDGKPTGIAAGEAGGTQTPPSVFNIRLHIAQIWDARAPNVRALVVESSVNPVETFLDDVLGRVPRYVELFRRAFPNDSRPISLKNVGEAIEAFERGLVSNSRWDRFAAGDASALTLEEKLGLRVFLKSGCVACHSGPQVGGTMYQKVGLAYPWPNQKGPGHDGGTNSIADRMVFQVPSLKNIAETAPYFHDSSTSNLQAAIRLMGHHQLGLELSKEEVDAIAAWMRSLTSEVDPAYIAAPDLPPEG